MRRYQLHDTEFQFFQMNESSNGMHSMMVICNVTAYCGFFSKEVDCHCFDHIQPNSHHGERNVLSFMNE